MCNLARPQTKLNFIGLNVGDRKKYRQNMGSRSGPMSLFLFQSSLLVLHACLRR
jgi:hypothetical protein